MEINSNVGSLASQTSQAPDAVNMAVLRKAIDIQAEAALRLIDALPAVSNPSHLGQNIDQTA
ncbi:MAG: YjfB family protein [Zoogloeaceae bacterium]|jgi:hypothetical protein|nr:YjfB family protein [Zoogloeaceae bacterium]